MLVEIMTAAAGRAPGDCECIEGRIVVYNGIHILGLGGCRKYRERSYGSARVIHASKRYILDFCPEAAEK